MPARITQPLPSNFGCTIKISHDDKSGFKAELLHKLVGVRDCKKVLSAEETSLILALMGEAAGNELSFDPPPQNFISELKAAVQNGKRQEQQDAGTMDKQAATIEGLREQVQQLETELEATKRAGENAVERIKELTEELRKERLPIQPIAITETAKPETAAPEPETKPEPQAEPSVTPGVVQ